jgi:predicted nuclease of predicted toxin-antitoxin system
MKLVADESVDRKIVWLLRQEGHDVVYIAELDAGISDDIVLRRASEIGALLITADKDFGELVFRQQLIHYGVMLIRLAGLSPDAKPNVVAAAIRERGPELENSFSVVSPGWIRIRRNP